MASKQGIEEAHIQDADANEFQGLVLKDVIPTDRPPWYADWTLWKLNLLLLSGLLTQTATGFDASKNTMTTPQ
jgi:hypothetical protein